jgi:hypothetical protein
MTIRADMLDNFPQKPCRWLAWQDLPQ